MNKPKKPSQPTIAQTLTNISSFINISSTSQHQNKTNKVRTFRDSKGTFKETNTGSMYNKLDE